MTAIAKGIIMRTTMAHSALGAVAERRMSRYVECMREQEEKEMRVLSAESESEPIWAREDSKGERR